jgi:formate hydrogenlyase transcriptional activator
MATLVSIQSESGVAGRYEALLRVSQAIGSHRDPQKLFSTLTAELKRLIHFAFIGIARFEGPMDQAIWLLTECNHGCEKPASGCVPEPELLRSVYERQESLVIPFLKIETRFPQMSAHLGELGIQSVCVLPMTTVHRRLGILALGSELPFVYTDEEVGFLSMVANQVALALDDALNFEASKIAQTALRQKQDELQRERDRLKLLLDVSNNVISNLNLRDLLRAISASVRRIMQCDAVSVDLPDADATHLLVYALDFPESKGLLQEETLIPMEGTDPGRVFKTGKPRVCTTATLSLALCNLAIDEGIKSGCLLPLISRNRVALGRRQDEAFSDDDVHFLMQVANQVAIAMDNALAYGEIEDLRDRLTQEKLYLQDEIRSDRNLEEIIGNSRALRQVLRQVETVAPADSAVLILGETGTGKELIARSIHNLSARKTRTFVKLNCAAIPTGLLESELFEHEKGAFTGAITHRIGRFEPANHGTVFLDEIGEIPLELQPKLLRVLQEREFERLGSTHTLKTDARLVAATNRDLAAMVEEQEFRADLHSGLSFALWCA